MTAAPWSLMYRNPQPRPDDRGSPSGLLQRERRDCTSTGGTNLSLPEDAGPAVPAEWRHLAEFSAELEGIG
ncbi:hypothetical protein ACLF3G_10520 [Falsiroseomonas sp. HC035]|uniref:hypothetical protein n=1 Tax=Falsiroseomonas sp. HC035 TaxID=3390999 RepID=UPI003D3167FA